ncbi:MAG: sugar nucleotide-binding protein [Nanoarchaeota archaeon]
MKEKILLLGSKGRLASFILKKHPEVIGYDKDKVDISNKEQITNLILKEKPSLIINCAAITDIEYCNKNPEECWKVNTLAVKYLVEAARKVNAKLIHFSSNYTLKPVNEYGWSKLASEAFASQEGLVIRTDIYDTKTFIINQLLNTKENLNAYNDKFFNPIYMGTLADYIFKLKDKTGILNVVTKEKLSFYEFALKVCEIFNIDKSRVISTKSQEEKKEIRRPKDLYLEPDIDFSIHDDLQNFKKDLKK